MNQNTGVILYAILIIFVAMIPAIMMLLEVIS